jgi:transposase
MTIFPELFDQDMQISQVHVADEITLTLHAMSPSASCPNCGTISKRVQSRYSRTLHDLPSSGRAVHLIIHVRRFFCKKSTCAQKIFAERLPELCRPHAQRTIRLQKALSQLGLAAGGQAGTRIGSELGISGSRDTILRLVRQHHLPDPPKSRIVGLDDWAWKRRLRYGTLICDLERGLPIDLLPDRSVETVSAWLQAHPHVEMVSRDGSSEYTSAIKKGAPQARQVSDRWHLTKNLADCVSVVLAHCFAQIRRAEQAAITPEEEGAQRREERRPSETRAVQQAQLARQAERLARYEHIIALRKQGMKSADIATQVGMAERTVRHWLAHGSVPDYTHRWQRASPIDPYKAYLAERWNQGCHNRLQLLRELRAKGYRGSQRGVYRYVATLEPSSLPSVKRGSAPSRGQKVSPTQPNPLLTLSVKQVTWLFFRKPNDLKEGEQENLRLMRQATPRAETAYQLVKQFLQMVRERTGEQLDAWLKEVEASHLEAFESFVTGVQQDKDAVLAGLTLPWSNGPLEGHVNRLKLIKRSMYGRAKFDLLRFRVLHHPEKREVSQDAKMGADHKERRGRAKKLRAGENTLPFQHTTFRISGVA